MTQEIEQFVDEMRYKVMFAKCNVELPYADMLREFHNFMEQNTVDFVPFRTTEENAWKYNLQVLSIIEDDDIDPQKAQYHLGTTVKLKPKATSITKFFPITTKWLVDLMPGIVRVKLSKLPPSNICKFHRHPYRIPQLDGIFHIPLITNPGVRFHTRQVGTTDPVQSCHLSAGHLWWFSAEDHIEHAVTNFGTEDRWHLWINTRIIDTKFNVIGHNDRLYNSLVTGEKFYA